MDDSTPRLRNVPPLKIVTMGRDDIESARAFRVPYAVISIRDTGRRTAKLRPSGLCVGVLQLAFHDTEPVAGFVLPVGVRVFTDRQATTVRRFVRMHSTAIELLVVQCEQGASRSPAVAAAVGEAFGLDTRPFFERFTPNRHVFGLLRQAFSKR